MREPGGYSSNKRVEDLSPPPKGPAPGVADRDDLAAILAKHEDYKWWDYGKTFVCKCGEGLGDSYPDPTHRAHVAQMVLESDWMANAKAEVWVECLQAVSWAVDRGTAEQAIGYVLTNNPYDRADRVDAEDGPSDECQTCGATGTHDCRDYLTPNGQTGE